MRLLQKLRYWCPQPNKPITIKKLIKPVFLLFVATMFIALFSLPTFVPRPWTLPPPPQGIVKTQIPAVTPITKDRALDFIQNVLLFDIAEYNITLIQDGVTLPSQPDDPTIEIMDYALESNRSRLDVSVAFTNNVLTGCILSAPNGSVLPAQTPSDLIDSANVFLEKYQAFTGDNLTDMINTLSLIDGTKNLNVTSGNVKLNLRIFDIQNGQVDSIFRWLYTFNGTDYTALGVTFRNGALYALRDDRSLYKIGNTDVNITKEQAISAAMKYVQNYSYTGVTGSYENPAYVEIGGFNITEENITAELNTYPRESSTLYPYWSVQLPLTETYPGNIWALLVSVWADSGKVFLCQPLGVQ